MTTVSAFLDESGNTGQNFLDKSQPFYVCGGWIVQDENRNEFKQAILDWEKDAFKGNEVKSSNILKRKIGIKLVSNLFKELGKVGIPTYSIFEKRFGIIAKFLEASLDHDYNNTLPSEFYTDPEFKYSHADDLYRLLTDEQLIEFQTALRKRDQEIIKPQYEKLAQIVRESKLQNLSSWIDGAPVERALAYLCSGNNITNAVNYTSFLTQMVLLEGFARISNTQCWNVVHDQTGDFQPLFLDLKEKLKNGYADFLRDEFLLRIPNQEYLIGDLEFVDSSTSPEIRAADLYVGMIRYLLDNRLKLLNESNQEVYEAYVSTLAPLARYTSPKLSQEFPPIFHEVLSTKVMIELMGNLRIITNE